MIYCEPALSQNHRSAHVDLFTQLSSNNFCSTVLHIVHHKTCSPSLLVVVAVAVLMLQYNWTLFLPQLITEKEDFFAQKP